MTASRMKVVIYSHETSVRWQEVYWQLPGGACPPWVCWRCWAGPAPWPPPSWCPAWSTVWDIPWSNVPPVILSNIAQQPPTEARPLEDSSVHVVLAVSRLYWDLLLPLTAAWYGKTVLNQRDETLEMDFIKYFEGANILKCSSTFNIQLTHWEHHGGAGVLTNSVPLRAATSCHLAVWGGQLGGNWQLRPGSYICRMLSSSSEIPRTHHRTCSPRPRCLCNTPAHTLGQSPGNL